MPNVSTARRMAERLAQFRAATGGNIAVIFAIVLLPLLGFVGVAVDYSRVAKYRSQMQAAVDSAALMVSRDVAASPTMTPAQITAKARAYFNALFVRPEVNNIVVTANYSSSGKTTLTMTGSGSIQTEFLRIIGFPTLAFGTSSQTTWGNQLLRVALSLDNTGSMADAGKMSAMQTAAKNLVTTLSGLAKNSGDVYISLIPFAKDVNVGPLNVTASWLDWSDWDSKNTTTTSTTYCDSYFLFFCLHYTTVTTTTTKPHATWGGCVMDRMQDYDTKNTTPTSVQTSFPTEDYDFCRVGNVPYLQQIMGLSYDWTSIKAKIDLMAPTGGTNQPIGLAWAWQSLTQGAPLSAPPEDSTNNYVKVIVHLSDGENTQNRWPVGSGQTTAQYNASIDARQRILCDNIKAANIRIISMQVNTDGTPTQPVMQYCASTAADFYLVTSASQIIDAFDKIAVSLTKLRIAQ